MALNLNNPVTQVLDPSQLAGPHDQCYQPRTGYEVLVNDEKYALIPVAGQEQAQLGEEVDVDSMGLFKRGKIVRVLSGVQKHYTDQVLLGETEDGVQILERTYDKDKGFSEQNLIFPKLM